MEMRQMGFGRYLHLAVFPAFRSGPGSRGKCPKAGQE